jgi:serine/threonine-protein kinase
MTSVVSQRPGPTTVGRYELLGEIARGGMAVLYLARELGLQGIEKLVVLKRVLPELASRKDIVAMFLDEARIVSLLQHPNLPHGYGLVEQDGEYLFAMEYLHGTDVRRLSRVAAAHGGLPLEHAISIGIGLCAGLHYAHERLASDGTPMNLVHRDVGPRNVFVTYDGGVKLLDFGIAQAEQRRSKTATGTTKGTLQYMSPEQIHAERVDRRSDIFAASVMLWELTVGRALFSGSSDYSVMTAIVQRGAPPPSTIRPDYPPALEAIVMRGLQQDPADRFQTAEELQLALEQFAREHQLPTSSVGLARFMRETFRDDVDAYHDAQAHGTLAARALEEVSAASREREAALDEVPADAPATRSAVPARRTRPLGSDAGAPRSTRRWWLAGGAVAIALAAGFAWWQLSGDRAEPPAAEPRREAVQAPPPAPPPATVPIDAPPAPPVVVAPTPPAPSRPASHAPTKTPPHPAKTTAKKRLSNDDLDAAFPPK